MSAIDLREAEDSHDDRLVSQEKSRVERILSGELSPGEFLVFRVMLGYFFAPILAISQLGMEFETVDAGLRRVNDAFEYPSNPATAARSPSAAPMTS